GLSEIFSAMRSAILILLTISSAFAVQCLVSIIFENRHVMQHQDCAEGEEYCMKTWLIDGNETTRAVKSCGNERCTSEFCSDDTRHGGICCCKGNFCNSATGNSVLVTSLAAAAAVWLRL
ncbi:hypothetical protein PMAYCL1PPCAC_20289, partial [Pristionchus mayeri]